MIVKSLVQTIDIWREHSETYNQQPLIQQQVLIMGDQLTS